MEQPYRSPHVSSQTYAAARAAEAGVNVDPDSGRVSERRPAGAIAAHRADRRETTTVRPRVEAGEKGNRRLVGEEMPDEGDFVLYLPGDTIPPEHRDLPTVAAVHRRGVWEPEGGV